MISACDWIDLDGQRLIQRTAERHLSWSQEGPWMERVARLGTSLRPLANASGDVVGRASIKPFWWEGGDAVISVGGLRASTIAGGVCGILVGSPTRAARDSAIPVVEKRAVIKWANEQAELISDSINDPWDRAACAATVISCGGYTGRLPVVFSNKGWMNLQEIAEQHNLPNEFILVKNKTERPITESLMYGQLQLDNNVLAIAPEPLILLPYFLIPFEVEEDLTLASAIIEALSKAWNIGKENVEIIPDNKAKIGKLGRKVFRYPAIRVRNSNK